MAKDFSIYNIQNEGKGQLFHRQNIAGKLDKRSEFIVEEGYVAFILKDGIRQETLSPGRYEIFGKKHGLAGIFDEKRLGGLNIIYISNNYAKKIVKWGIPNKEMEMRDPLTDVDFMMGAFGEMTIRVANPEQFYMEWLTDKQASFSIEDFQELALTKLKEKVKSAIIRTIKSEQIPYHSIDENTERIAKGVLEILSKDFVIQFGINVIDFVIVKIAIPEDKKNEIRRKYDANLDEMKAKQAKQEEKNELKEYLAEIERLGDKEWEKEKYLLELKGRDHDKYLDVCRAIGWDNSGKVENKGPLSGNFCSKCGNQYSKDCVFCQKCGNRVAPSQCECGATLAANAGFCSKCGKKAN